MRSIALMNQKGGVGKTTTTVNLAAAAARLGKRTLLVDLDPQAHATLHLGADPAALDGSVYDLLLDPSYGQGHDPAHPIISTREKLSLIPAETDLAAAETELQNAPERQHRLKRALDRLSDRFDLILLDCPPALGLLTLNGLAAASEVLIPMQAHFLALQGVSKLLETVQLVRGSLNSSITVAGVVLCMHDHQTTLSQEVVADLTEFFDTARGTDVPWNAAKIFDPPIRRNIKLAECPSFGQTIFEYAPEAAGAKDYDALARSVLGITEPTPMPKPEPRHDSRPEPEPPVVNVVPQQPQPSETLQNRHHQGHHESHTHHPYSTPTPPPDNPA
ncbi:MAG: ParA family protein [Planctomycetota bacterium]